MIITINCIQGEFRMSSAITTLVKNSNVPVAKIAAAGSLALMLSACGTSTDSNVYSGYPVTLKGYSGSKTTSLGYTGQIARHVLHDSLKSLAGKGTGSANSNLKTQMLSYFSKKDKNRIIIAPKSRGTFKISQTNVDQISKEKNLIGKTYKGTISGMPNNMTGSELVMFWIDKASSSNKGVDLQSGYNYLNFVSKGPRNHQSYF